MGGRRGRPAGGSPGNARAPARPARAVPPVERGLGPRGGGHPRSVGPPGRAEGEPARGPPGSGGRGMTGTVYLVGAGPGDPGLITVRGAEVLRAADVVVYDRLASPALLDLGPADAERVYAGKEPGRSALPQEGINRLLVERALAGSAVVRLKGGDPFVFGRGGEEALACIRAGVAVEVVPGVSSAVAARGLAGIPGTRRRLAQRFA